MLQYLSVPFIVVGVVVAFFAAISVLMRNYIKVPPNKVAIVSGRKRKLKDGTILGFRLVHGGATLRLPGLERVDYLDLNVIPVNLETRKAITKQGVAVTVQAVANVKIGSDDRSLGNSAERFLGMPITGVKEVILQTLEAHLRAICGTLTVEEINSDRQAFAHRMTADAAEDFQKMGLVIDVFAVQHISDEHGYLDSLGRKRTSEVVRDAEIGEADAKRDAMMRTAGADKEGQTARYQADVLIAEAEKEKNLQVAAFAIEVNAKNAEAAQAGPLADARARQNVKKEEIRIQEIETQARIAVAQREAERKRQELESTIVAEAEAAQRATILRAEGEKSSQILLAEGEKQRRVALAEADARELEFEGLGESSKIAKIAEAEAGRVRTVGQAEADAILARGMAEAEAMRKKAEALKMYGEAAMMQMVVEKLPEIARAFAEPLASIDKVSILEMGGGGGNGHTSGVSRFVGNVGGGMAAMSEFLKANFGLDLAEVIKTPGGGVPAVSTPVEPAAAPQKPPKGGNG
jgi:flotillin